MVREGHGKHARITCPAALINGGLLGARFRQKCSGKLPTSKLPVLFIHERVLKYVFVVNSRDGVPPYRYRKQHRREMHESAKANGRVPLPHIPVSYSWVISFPLTFCRYTSLPRSLWQPVSASFSLCFHRWRCAYLSAAVSQGLWWGIRIADGVREACLNAAWCFAKLCALKPSRHESSPVTARCVPLQLRLSFGRQTPGPN